MEGVRGFKHVHVSKWAENIVVLVYFLGSFPRPPPQLDSCSLIHH